MDNDEIRNAHDQFMRLMVNQLAEFDAYIKHKIDSEDNHQTNCSNGITLDYKTFAELINILSYGVTEGTVNKEFLNKIIKIGSDQQDIKQSPNKDVHVFGIKLDKPQHMSPEDIVKVIKLLKSLENQ